MTGSDTKTDGRHGRDRAIDALMDLAAERDWDRIGVADIAERAGLSLSAFRDLFPSKGAVLGAFARRIDHEVLQEAGEDMATRSPRDRLFDVLMRRLDALSPYKASLRRMMPALVANPLSMGSLNQVALNSMRFMLASAEIDSEGPLGFIKLQGAVVMFARVMETWLHDDDPALARTMALLDEELRRGGMIINRLEDVCRFVGPLSGAVHRAADRARHWAERPPAPRGNADLDPSI